jgi:hypothetical protein
MGLFSKPKVPSLDTGALLRIQNENEAKQKAIVGGLRGNLQPLGTNFETKRNALGSGFQTGTEDVIGRYGQDLSNVNAADTAARNAANVGFREQSFREVPEIQRSIRESLGGSGTIGNAAALSALSRPVLEANRASRDFTSQNTVAGLAGATGRSEKLADTGFGARSGALETKLGLDTGTIDYLTSIGREDLVREAEGLLGIEEQSGANKLGIEQARQSNEMAKAAASNARRGQVLSSLGSLAGTGVGFLAGGPVGAGLGSQLGSTVGNLAGGGTGGGTFDPTLLYALAQRNKSNVSRSLGGGRSTPTTSNYSTMVG